MLDDEAPLVVMMNSKDLSLDQVHAAIDAGATVAGDVPLPKKGEEDNNAAAAEAEPNAGGSSANASGDDAAKTKEEKKKKNKNKKKKLGSAVPGAMSKKLDKRNTGLLSFEEDDGW